MTPRLGLRCGALAGGWGWWGQPQGLVQAGSGRPGRLVAKLQRQTQSTQLPTA